MYQRIIDKLFQNKNFIKHLSSTYLLMGINMAIMILLSPFMLKKMGTEDLGIWLLLTNILMYFSLSNMGFLQALVTEIPHRKKDQLSLNKLISTVFFALVGFSAIGLVLAIGIYVGFDYFFKITPDKVSLAKGAFWPAYLSFLLVFLSSVFYNIMLSSSKIVEKNLLEILKVIISNGLIFWLLLSGYGLIEIMWATFTITFLYSIALYWQAKRALTFEVAWQFIDNPTFKKLAKPSLYFFVIGLGTQVVFYSDNLLIGTLLGTGFVTMYSYTFRIPDVCLKLIMKITDMKLPKITHLNSERRFKEILQIHNRLMLFTLTIAVPTCIFLFIWGTDLLKLWLGGGKKLDTNLIDERIMWIFSTYLLVHAIIHVTSVFISGMGIHKRMAYCSLLEAALNLVFSIFLFHHIGLVGIALGTLLASLPSLIFVLYEFYTYIYRSESLDSYKLLFKIS